MAEILQTALWNTFSWMNMGEFWLKFHWSLSSGVQPKLTQYRFRNQEMACRQIIQWWPSSVTHKCMTLPKLVNSPNVNLFYNICINQITFVLLFILMTASLINASFSGSHSNHNTFIYVLLIHVVHVTVSVIKISCVILQKIISINMIFRYYLSLSLLLLSCCCCYHDHHYHYPQQPNMDGLM